MRTPRKPITKKHTLLLWGGILGTVYARNPETGECKYFDYNLAEAKLFAKVAECTDLRIDRVKYQYGTATCEGPRSGALGTFGIYNPTTGR